MSTTNENTRNEEHFHPEHALELLQKLQLLLSAGENGGGLCDVVLIAGKNGQRVPGHRVILAASSPYFEALFTGNMRESTATEVTLGDDVHGDYLLPLVKFCYTGKIDICADTVDELVLTASRLQLNAVVAVCSEFMKRRLDASNCLGVAALAELLSLNDLKQSADRYACRHFFQVSQQGEFLQLNIEQLMILIGSDDLNVPSEEAVYHSVMSWVRYEMDEGGKRSKHIPALLGLVRLSFLPQTFLTQDGIWELCHENACLPLLKLAFEEANVPIRSRRSKPRKPMQPSLVAVWLDSKQERLEIAEYSLGKDEWKLFDKTLSARSCCEAAFFNNELVIVDGRDGGDLYHTVESINLDTMTSSKLPSITRKRRDHRIAVLDGLLYVVGGIGSFYGDTLNTLERYDPNTSKWSGVAPMSVGRRSFGLAALNGRLYAVGGENDGVALNSTECYDPQTDEWTQLANLVRARFGFGIASGNGFLYAVGGWGDNGKLKSIERYDPQLDKWTEICSLGSPTDKVSCLFLDDCLLVVLSNDKGISLQEYNLATGTWTECATLLSEEVSCLRAVLK